MIQRVRFDWTDGILDHGGRNGGLTRFEAAFEHLHPAVCAGGLAVTLGNAVGMKRCPRHLDQSART
jgi:hypothetical protein